MPSGVFDRTDAHREMYRRNLSRFIGVPIRKDIKKKISKSKTGVYRSTREGASRYQARKAWMSYWNELIPSGYVVHHIDFDYTNNSITNLALVIRTTHNQIHKAA